MPKPLELWHEHLKAYRTGAIYRLRSEQGFLILTQFYALVQIPRKLDILVILFIN